MYRHWLYRFVDEEDQGSYLDAFKWRDTYCAAALGKTTVVIAERPEDALCRTAPVGHVESFEEWLKPLSHRVNRRDLVDWAGAPWWPPPAPCHYCSGTGVAHGTYATQIQRPGIIRSFDLGSPTAIDRNLVARALAYIQTDTVQIRNGALPTDPLIIAADNGLTLPRFIIAKLVNTLSGKVFEKDVTPITWADQR